MPSAIVNKTKSVLLCAATRWEAAPLAGLSNGSTITLVQTGIGAANVAAALGRIDASKPFDFVLSVGLAGALQPGMNRGDIVVDLQGADAELPAVARRIADAENLRVHFGRVANSDTVIGPLQKAALGEKLRASAVDMESAAIRTWAQGRKVPLLVVRAILDECSDRLPSAIPAGENFSALARYVFACWSELPLLLATGWRQKRAMANLGRFLPRFLEAL